MREIDRGDKVLGIQRHLFGFDWLEIFNFISFKMDYQYILNSTVFGTLASIYVSKL